jgi:hypothetical protein
MEAQAHEGRLHFGMGRNAPGGRAAAARHPGRRTRRVDAIFPCAGTPAGDRRLLAAASASHRSAGAGLPPISLKRMATTPYGRLPATRIGRPAERRRPTAFEEIAFHDCPIPRRHWQRRGRSRSISAVTRAARAASGCASAPRRVISKKLSSGAARRVDDFDRRLARGSAAEALTRDLSFLTAALRLHSAEIWGRSRESASRRSPR